MNGRYEWTFEADVFTVWLVYEFDERNSVSLADARCDCDRWERNRNLEPDDRFCRHLYAARWAVETELCDTDSSVERCERALQLGDALRVVTADVSLESVPTARGSEGDR